jgi:hypothetical protein
MVSFRPVFALALLVCFLAPLKAHDLYRSESKLEVRGREVKVTMTFNLLALAARLAAFFLACFIVMPPSFRAVIT